MPRRKVTENNDVDIPVIKNGGKVTTKEGEAIDIQAAVEMDTSPVIPEIPTTKPKDEKSTEQQIQEVAEEIEEAATIQPVPVDERQLRQELLDIGYALSQRILGENKDLNTNPISDKHISSIKCLLDIYKTVKGASALENFIKD
ncbi:hypothetical protein [Megamonas hypermegale]|uniref:hypothetical protein n=1 Tax=Megamonas hypermegale TaxID=158847 RepID=UPI0026ED3C9E|nr:hypothetical protein [Megamonas hypermegale]